MLGRIKLTVSGRRYFSACRTLYCTVEYERRRCSEGRVAKISEARYYGNQNDGWTGWRKMLTSMKSASSSSLPSFWSPLALLGAAALAPMAFLRLLLPLPLDLLEVFEALRLTLCRIAEEKQSRKTAKFTVSVSSTIKAKEL